MTSAELCPCPSCGAVNRVPAERLAQRPSCGRCRAPLFAAAVLPLDEAGFRLHRDRSTLPLLVDFWAQWCGPCRAMAPALEAAAQALAPRVRVAKVDIDAAPALAAQLAIQSVPTLLLLHGGRTLARTSGALAAPQIRTFVEQALQKGPA